MLWNHPNQHSGTCRYYKSWKKGFKVRVALDDYMLKGGFVFKSKKLSAQENKTLQSTITNTTTGKPTKVSGRVTLHIDENSSWLPLDIRGGHFIHNLHFYNVFGIRTPNNFDIKHYLERFEEYFCPFTCLTKGTQSEIEKIVKKEDYLNKSKYREINADIDLLLNLHEENTSSLLFGTGKDDGFPITYILQGIAYIIAASTGNKIKGKRVLGSYINLIKDHLKEKNIKIKVPNKGTCLVISNGSYVSLVGYINNQFNKRLITKKEGSKVFIREPEFEECIEL